jgi:pimeloyl-ACP methyl ester carboxylesterase
MPLLSIFRLIFTLISWAILAGAAYLLWRWSQGTIVVDEGGREHLIREDWLLWVGLGLGGWSLFLGKFFWNLVLARADDDGIVPERGDGRTLTGADGAELFVESLGPADGDTLVLTHGAGVDSTCWYLAKNALGIRYRILTWDLPGLGRSKGGKIDLESYAENLRVVIQSAGRPVVVVGHSMGGMTIQTLARRHPEMFGTEIVGTVLLNTTYTDPLKTMILSGLAQALRPLLKVLFHIEIALLPLAWLSAWQSYLSGSAHIANRLTFGKGVTRRQLDHVALLGSRNSPASIAKGNLAMFNWDATGAIATIVDPLLILAGQGDIVTKPEAGAEIASTAVSPQLHTIEGANHMSFLDHAAEYHELIDIYAAEAFARAAERPVGTPST